MHKKHRLKIKTIITDELGKTKSIEQEIDVDALNNLHEGEAKAIEIGEEADTFVMKEIIKKKKKLRWKNFTQKILTMLKTAKGRYRFEARQN